MKKIWTLLVAAITVLAVLTSGCGSSAKLQNPLTAKKQLPSASPSPHSTTPSSYPYVKALKKKQKN